MLCVGRCNLTLCLGRLYQRSWATAAAATGGADALGARTIFQPDGPNHLGSWLKCDSEHQTALKPSDCARCRLCAALSSIQTALITSACGEIQSLSINWPEQPRTTVRAVGAYGAAADELRRFCSVVAGRAPVRGPETQIWDAS